MRISPRSLCAPIVLALLTCGQLHAGVVYLALGDSTTFGYDESLPSSTMPSFGDQGFVRPFADFLGSINGGVRPQVVNLAISGELSSSFFSGQAPPGYRDVALNLNYSAPSTPQNSLMLSTLDVAHAAGNSVYVTLGFGGNDFNYLITTPAWQMATPDQQQVLFGNLLNQVALNYQTVLTEVRMHAPGAHILLPNFIDSTLPDDPAYAFNELASGAANQALQQIATAFGAGYVDFYSVIHGHAPQLVNSTGNHHLNQAGYAAVALALDAAVVPEPASVAMLGIGIVGLVGYGWRQRSAG